MYYNMDASNIKEYVNNNIPIAFKIYTIYATPNIQADIEALVNKEGNIITTDRAETIFNLTKRIKSEAITYLKYYITKIEVRDTSVEFTTDYKLQLDLTLINGMTTNYTDIAVKKIPLKVIQNYINEVLKDTQYPNKVELNNETLKEIQTAIAEI